MSKTKRFAGKSLAAITAAALAMVPVTSLYADEEKTMNLYVKIVAAGTIFDESLAVPYTTETLTAGQVFSYVDEQNDSLTIKGIDTDFITEVNGIAGGQTETGWDGWMFWTNKNTGEVYQWAKGGSTPGVGINEYEMTEGETLILYYSDQFVSGYQFPEVTYSVSEAGDYAIAFTSEDTTYDAAGNASVATNPVTGMKAQVTLMNDETLDLDVDGEGKLNLTADQIAGNESFLVRVSKVSEAGIPLVMETTFPFDVTKDMARYEKDQPAAGDTTPVLALSLLLGASAAGLVMKKKLA